jgi:hypothetical protein
MRKLPLIRPNEWIYPNSGTLCVCVCVCVSVSVSVCECARARPQIWNTVTRSFLIYQHLLLFKSI